MSEFTFYPPDAQPGDIDTSKLSHRYYVQLAPDGHHLVPGMLQQDVRPTHGKWLEIGKIDRDLPKRYFVQYTDFNTLVPGSVVQGSRLPKGKWKEIKKNSLGSFYRVVYDSAGWYFLGEINEETIFAYGDEFNDDKVYPVTDLIEPGVYVPDDPDHPVYFTMYYFEGDFAALGEDASQLIEFASPGAYFTIVLTLPGVGEVRTGSMVSSQGDNGLVDFRAAADTPNGQYSFVMGVTKNDVIQYYVFFEYLFELNNTPPPG